LHPTNAWRLRGGVDFDFATNQIIPPAGFLVLVGFDPAADDLKRSTFQTRYGAQATLTGPWIGKLSNSGETLELFAPDNPQTIAPEVGFVPYVSVERVTYANTPPWALGADGTGFSLRKFNPAAFSDDPANWIAAAPTCGGNGAVADSDGDGIPDDWESRFGLTNGVNDAGLDPDHDGLSNLQEYLANTDPKDPGSRLQIAAILPATNAIEIHFIAAPQRSYSLMFADPGSPSTWRKLADINAEAQLRNVTLTDPLNIGPGGRLYRLVTPRLP